MVEARRRVSSLPSSLNDVTILAAVNDMAESARSLALVPEAAPAAEPADGNAATNAAKLRKDPAFHATLVCVERAAEMIRTLQRDNETASRQIASLREQLRREQNERQAEADKLEQLIRDWHGKVKAAESGRAEANALAVAAVTRCEEMAANEAELLKRLSRAQARTAEAENYLVGLQKAIEFELSDIVK